MRIVRFRINYEEMDIFNRMKRGMASVEQQPKITKEKKSLMKRQDDEMKRERAKNKKDCKYIKN